MRDMRQISTAEYPFCFFMADSSDHITGKTGLTPTVTISKNGGTFSPAYGAVTSIGNGWYALDGNTTDRNTPGDLLIHAEAAGADPFDGKILIVVWNPFDPIRLGLYALPDQPAGEGGGLPIGHPGGTVVIKEGSLTDETFADGAITADVIAANAITEEKIDYGAITEEKFGLDAFLQVTGPHREYPASGAITTRDLSEQIAAASSTINININAVGEATLAVGAAVDLLPSAADIDAQLSTSHGAGSWEGGGGPGGDPLSNIVPGNYTPDQAGYKLGLIGLPSATIPQPLTHALTITITRGDDYDAADGRAIDIPVPSAPDLTGETDIFFRCRFFNAEVTEIQMTVIAPRIVRLQLSRTLTETIKPGAYRYDVECRLSSGRVVTPIRYELFMVEPDVR